MEEEDQEVNYKDWHLVCPSADPWPAPWGGWSWAGWRWELRPGCTSPQTLWGAAAAETRGAPAERKRAELLLQRCCRSKNSSSEQSVILNVLPSDNTRPETARSHSGWPCTSSCTPPGLHQSEEEENARSLAMRWYRIISVISEYGWRWRRRGGQQGIIRPVKRTPVERQTLIPALAGTNTAYLAACRASRFRP